MEFPSNPSPLSATPLALRPGDFPLGSLESRAAARALLDNENLATDQPNRLRAVVMSIGKPVALETSTLGSVESRAAARAMLKRADITTVMICTGLPWPISGPPIVNPPDTVAYHAAPDDSIVEVICRTFTVTRNTFWPPAGGFSAWIGGIACRRKSDAALPGWFTQTVSATPIDSQGAENHGIS